MYRWLLFALISTIVDRAYTDTNYRLNVPLKPKAYSITITPYFDTGDDRAFTFDGEVSITFTTESATRQIKLHSEDLTFKNTQVFIITGVNITQTVPLDLKNSLRFNKNYTFAYINLQDSLQVGEEYVLKIEYQGPIRNDLNGFYRTAYLENGVKKWLGVTNLEPIYARRVFPCFDEPSLKATFALTIDRPESFQPSLANTKLSQRVSLSNGYVREIFHPSPVMSTYLVAFLISEFKGVEKTNGTREFGVFVRPDGVNQTDYAVNYGQKVVNALGDYFGIDYYSTDANLKLDHVALTEFVPVAMENWGLITYSEETLLYVPEISDPDNKILVVETIAHETTHMWFGNLVTCHWWSDTWLNEGFANYFGYYITALIEPDLGSADALVTSSFNNALRADEILETPAISNSNVNSPAEIEAHFGTVSYQKAGSVIRMMHHLIGDEAFKMGLNTYLENNKFGVSDPNKMYEALDTGVQYYNALDAYPNTNISEVMNSWISQPGHPVLHVEINYDNDTVILTQKRFYNSTEFSTNETYNIPITFTTGQSPDFTNTKPVFIMKNRSHTFSIANISLDHTWAIFNLQVTGFYRVNYDDHTWQLIITALNNDEQRRKIHHLNRAQIVDDVFELFFADEIKFDRVLRVLRFLRNEEEYAVWTITVSKFQLLLNIYGSKKNIQGLDQHLLSILESPIKRLGYEVRSSDSFQTLRCRTEILELACLMNHKGCIQNAVKLFKELKENGTEISPSLRILAYRTGLGLGNGEDFNFLWHRIKNTNSDYEFKAIANVLGFIEDKDVVELRRYIVSILEKDNPIRNQDWQLSNVNTTDADTLLEELKKNVTSWNDMNNSCVKNGTHRSGESRPVKADYIVTSL